MAAFTQADMVQYIRRAAGEDGLADLDGEIDDTTFDDLGYDSIAMVEVALLVQQELGVDLPEEGTDKNSTPKQFVELVNKLLSAPSKL